MCQDLVAYEMAFPGMVDTDLLNLNPDEVDDSVGPGKDPLRDFVEIDQVAAESDEEAEEDETTEEAGGHFDSVHGFTATEVMRAEDLYQEYLNRGYSEYVAYECAVSHVIEERETFDRYDYSDPSLTTADFDAVPVSYGSFGRESMRRDGDAYTPDSLRGKESNARRHRPCNDRITVRRARVRADVLVYDDELGGGYIFSGLVAEVRHAR